MELKTPLVSVVIPTHNRSHLVGHAVRSALNQTLATIEVIVVIDGPDDATQQALALIIDDRLRIYTLETNQGGGVARNVGADHARAEWVAFLDDDDEWMPAKLALQLATAQQSPYRYPIIACRMIARKMNLDAIVPRYVIRKDEPLSEYLFCRRGLSWGDGWIIPTVIFTKTELVRLVHFKSLRRTEDVDWLLRAIKLAGVGIEFVADTRPLAIWNMRTRRKKTTEYLEWHTSSNRQWDMENRHLFTPRAYAAFLLLLRGQGARNTHDPRVFLTLLYEALHFGKPRLLDILIYCGFWMNLDLLLRKIKSRST